MEHIITLIFFSTTDRPSFLIQLGMIEKELFSVFSNHEFLPGKGMSHVYGGPDRPG